MEVLWILGLMLGCALFIKFVKTIGLMLAFYFFGWRPSILKEPIMESIAEECTDRVTRQALEMPDSQYRDLDEEDRKRWREETMNFARHVIEQYTLRYSLMK